MGLLVQAKRLSPKLVLIRPEYLFSHAMRLSFAKFMLEWVPKKYVIFLQKPGNQPHALYLSTNLMHLVQGQVRIV